VAITDESIGISQLLGWHVPGLPLILNTIVEEQIIYVNCDVADQNQS